MRVPVRCAASVLIIGTIRLPVSRMEAARIAMRRMIEASRAEPGCIAYVYAEDVLQPGLVHVIERWVDGAALDRHFASAHIRQWRAEWPSLEIGERRLTAFDVSGSRPV